MRILDAGCGSGRNLVYLLQNGAEIFAVDQNPEAVAYVRQLAAHIAPSLPSTNIAVADLDHLPFADHFVDVVLCNSVLHFSRDEAHLVTILTELCRVLRPGGLLFCRLASNIGMEFQRVHGRIFRVGDGQDWLLVDEPLLLALTRDLSATLVDPLKTTVVQDHRCMTTWVLRKRPTT